MDSSGSEARGLEPLENYVTNLLLACEGGKFVD
jgi:hypothetical protein